MHAQTNVKCKCILTRLQKTASFIKFYVKCVTENQKTQHLQSHAVTLMQLLFNWTWLYLEALPVALCYWWYFFQQTENTLSTVLWIVCATHAALTVQKGMKSTGCRSVKCLHAASLNLAPPAIKTSTCTFFWGFWGSGFPKRSVKCWMHLRHQANTEANLYMHDLQRIPPPPIWAFVERHGTYQQSAFHWFYVMKAKFCL